MRSVRVRIAFAGLLAAGWTFVAAQETAVAPATNAQGEAISPKGQSADVREGKLTDRPPRYYIWTDPQGWHLRSAAKEGGVIKFEGSIELTGGEFGKLRPVGLEAKGKFADAWRVDETRRKIDFKIFTSGAFDGFDFTISKAKDAQVQFDMKIGPNYAPARVFIGKDNAHPKMVPFSLPAEP
jgi:hypothetical protein